MNLNSRPFANIRLAALVLVLGVAMIHAQKDTPAIAPENTTAARPPASAASNPASSSAAQRAASAPADMNTTQPPVDPVLIDPNEQKEQLVLSEGTLAPPHNRPEVIDHIIYREQEVVRMMKHFQPLVETYIQDIEPDDDLGEKPVKDNYFIGKMNFDGDMDTISFLPTPGIAKGAVNFFTHFFSLNYNAEGFAAMIVPDGRHFDKADYDFKYLRREFLGQVRTMVFDVTPKKGSGTGRFMGRIWVEDQGYHIVRFNGIYNPAPVLSHYFHFDSWRTLMGPNLWLPSHVYSEETDFRYMQWRKLRFKAQTRLWGYDLKNAGRTDEMTAITIDAPQLQDQADPAVDVSPVRAFRAWEREAEDNILERLEKAGLLAPEGEVDKVLLQVVQNIEITNNIEIVPEARCRVLLTSPLESFTIGHTIVLSRGLIDTLPDEASLAVVLSHELAHIALGHRLDTKYAFNDRMMFADEKTMRKIGLLRNDREEADADAKAMTYLQNSPYKDKMGNAGLWLRQLSARASEIPSLIRPHFGNHIADGRFVRLASLMNSAPALKSNDVTQIAALPLGGRVKVDPWSSRLMLARSKTVRLLSAREKLPFEVTPFDLYLTKESSTDMALATVKPAGQTAKPGAGASRDATEDNGPAANAADAAGGDVNAPVANRAGGTAPAPANANRNANPEPPAQTGPADTQPQGAPAGSGQPSNGGGGSTSLQRSARTRAGTPQTK